MTIAINAEGIFKTFRSGWWKKREKEALKGVDLHIEEREIFGILGPNGAGKTTLLSILCTLLLPDRGNVHILGMDALQEGYQIRKRVNVVSGNANFLWSLTVKENLHYYGMLYGLTGKERERKVETLIDLFNLKEYRNIPFDELSTGLKQRLSLAKSLINDPEILFLDEPTVGLDPDISIRIREEILSIHKEREMTILVTTHNMKEVEYLCGRIAFLKEGKILTTGTADALKKMVRIGDQLKIEFTGTIQEDELLHTEGVINFSINGNLCDIVVDNGEKRLGILVPIIAQGGAQIKKVTMGQTDLEDVFVEFAKSDEEPF
jgi:ABC-2 type transport system ATP-binding protein